MCALGLSVGQVWANNWEYIGQNQEYQFYISPSTIKSSQKNTYSPIYQQAWFKFYIYNDLTKDGLSAGDYKLRLFQFDCAQQTLGVVRSIDYKADGTTVNSEIPSMINMKAVVPDSIGQGLSDAVCSGKYDPVVPRFR